MAARRLAVHDGDAAQGVDHVLEALEVDEDGVVHGHVEQQLHGLDGERRPAPRVGGVDLRLGVVVDDLVGRDRDPHVPQKGDKVDVLPVARQLRHHEGVRAALIGAA